MRFPSLVRVIVLILVVREHRSQIVEAKLSLGDSCIALVAQHYFRANSTVAVLTSDDLNEQHSISLSYKDEIQRDDVLQHMSRNMKSSFVMLQLSTANVSCYNNPADNKAVDYFIIKGKGDYISNSIRHFCCGALVDDRTHFVVHLEVEEHDANIEVETVLQELWTHQQQNAIVLARNGEIQMDIFTWFPLTRSPKVEVIDRCDGQLFR